VAIGSVYSLLNFCQQRLFTVFSKINQVSSIISSVFAGFGGIIDYNLPQVAERGGRDALWAFRK